MNFSLSVRNTYSDEEIISSGSEYIPENPEDEESSSETDSAYEEWSLENVKCAKKNSDKDTMLQKNIYTEATETINYDENENIETVNDSYDTFQQNIFFEGSQENISCERSQDNISCETSHSFNLESVGDALKHAKYIEKTNIVKKHWCIYCMEKKAKKQCFSRIAEHLEMKHIDEEDLRELKNLPKIKKIKNQPLTEKELERKRILDMVRDKGDHKHNIKTNNVEDFVTARRPRDGKTFRTKDFLPCPRCNRTILNNHLHRHVKNCPKVKKMESSKGKNNFKIQAKKTQGNFHKLADDAMIRIMAPLHMKSECVEAILHDDVVMQWLQYESIKYESSTHHDKMIRAKLRRLGKLIIAMRALLPNQINDLKSILNQNYYEIFIRAAKQMGQYDKNSKLMYAPATANDIGLLITDVCSTYIVLCGKSTVESEQSKKEAESFLTAHKTLWHKLIGKVIAESQGHLRRNKRVKLPTKSDTQKLHFKLRLQLLESIQVLQNYYNKEKYENLRNALVTYIQIANCKRSGEIERLKVIDAEVIESISEEYDKDIYASLSEEGKKYVNKYSRILIRGKKNRTVPILLTSEMRKALEIVLCKNYRNLHNIKGKNPYVFAIPNTEDRFVSACNILREFSMECGASDPETLRGTLFRKQMATSCMMLNLSATEIEDVATFLGHTEKTHKDWYRVRGVERDVTRVAKLLERAQGIYEEKNGCKKIIDEVQKLEVVTNKELEVVTNDDLEEVTEGEEDRSEDSWIGIYHNIKIQKT